MTEGLTAQMTQSPETGFWRVYVVVYGQSWWPTRQLATKVRIPTVGERENALKSIGYKPVKQGEPWEWTEDKRDESVLLIAHTKVTPL